MRNIGAYPITKEEKLHALDLATQLLAKDLEGYMGGIELTALSEVRKQVEAMPDVIPLPEPTPVPAATSLTGRIKDLFRGR